MTANGLHASAEGAAVADAPAQIPDHVVYRSFAHETVILNLQTGQYHGLNPTGGRMLELLAAGRTLREAAAALAAEYGRPISEVEGDVLAFCNDLLARGLMVMSRNGRH